VLDIIVKSFYGDYNVNFNKNIEVSKLGSHFIVDEKVCEIYKLDYLPNLIKINAIEKSKSFSNIEKILNNLIDLKLKKNSILVGIGGGIIQDITSFISSIWMRGIHWNYIPTTLLSQADSCIGSKSSINLNNVKNVIGTFFPPKNIYICNYFLGTLSDADIKSGIGEILKLLIINGDNIEYDDIRHNLDKYIIKALLIKKHFIEIDEHDKGIRQLLNYGHCFGHALESACNFKLPHGIAVSIGMNIANHMSLQLKMLSYEKYEKINKILVKNYNDFSGLVFNEKKFIYSLNNDKKNSIDFLRLIHLTNDEVVKTNIENNKKTLEKIFNSFSQLKFRLE